MVENSRQLFASFAGALPAGQAARENERKLHTIIALFNIDFCADGMLVCDHQQLVPTKELAIFLIAQV